MIGPAGITAGLLALALAGSVAAEERGTTVVHWQGDPVPVRLPLDAERRIDFPEPIADLDVPVALEQRSRIVLSPEGRLHWQAREAFAPERVLATSISGSLYQLDVGAAEDGDPSRIEIVDPLLAGGSRAALTDPEKLDRVAAALIPDFLRGGRGAGPGGLPTRVDLARFALSHYTGPARLIPELGAVPVPVAAIDRRALLRGQASDLVVRPLAQWQLGEHYVTALGVLNTGPRTVDFDPLALRGELLFAAALHASLQPAGSGHNGTVWAVVTAVPFNEALR